MNIRAIAFVVSVLTLVVMIPAGAGAAEQKQDQDEDTSSPSLRIGWDEFKKLYDAGAIEIIDVRGDVFFESGHIPGARSIPLEQVGKRVTELRRSKKPVVLYCA
jgi:3-mercaptopyruvate sulfurtransferase SseA